MGQRAFTLLEVVLVIAVLGLIVAFVYPELEANMRRRSLVESADKLRAVVVMTHARAMQDGVKYRIEFPGTPDPLDKYANKEVDTPLDTLQPIVKRQVDPVFNPEAYDEGMEEEALREGTRCVAVMPWTTEMFCAVSAQSPIAGPDISNEGHTTFVPLTLNPDGTCDKVAFMLTDLPAETELSAEDVRHILYVIVDGRTGQTWVQRAWRVEECEMMEEQRSQGLDISPVLRQDFTNPGLVTEENILRAPSKMP